MNLALLTESLRNAPVIERGNYRYFVHPLTDSIPVIQPELVREVCAAIREYSNLEVDYFLTMEAMGIHICAVLSQMTGLPFNIVRKRGYGLPGEVVLDQKTGYSKGEMFMNNVSSRDSVTVVDSVVSTGGTLLAVIKALEEVGAEVRDVVCVIERGEGAERVSNVTGIEVKTLVKIEVDDEVRILKTI